MTSVNQYILEHGNAEVERLRALNAELLAALEYDDAVLDGPDEIGTPNWTERVAEARKMRRAAIAKAKAKAKDR